jgi:uncharacterized protein YndB with AHSA1/START domain
MPPIVTSADIDRPDAEVFAYATDPTRFSEWQRGAIAIRRSTVAANPAGTARGPSPGCPAPWLAPGSLAASDEALG